MAVMAQNEVRKERRSAGEKALADQLTEQAKKRTPNAEKFRQARKYADAATKNPRFEENYGKSSIDGLPIHHFHRKGEFVVGTIGECQGETYGPSSFPFQVDIIDGTPVEGNRVIRLPGNRRLQLAIRKADCLYQRIRVTYRGKLHAKTGGQYEKVYLVEPAPLDKEPMTPAGQAAMDRIVNAGVAGKGRS
jgi:hypothetical protein